MVEVRALATDAVIRRGDEIVLLERAQPPHEGEWVLPGGLVEPCETARQACLREVAEEVHLQVEVIGFVGLFDDPDRDDRGNVSAAYLCEPVEKAGPAAGQEARQVATFPRGELPALGFDHECIITHAMEMVRDPARDPRG